MSTEIAKTDSNTSYLARYNDNRDPYEAFASEGGPGIQGRLLTCTKGEWGVGADKEPIKDGTKCLAIVDTMGRGWFRWWNGVVTDTVFGLVKDNFLVPHRFSLGDNEEDQWEKDPAGNPRDPWTRTYRMVLVEMTAPHGDLTFTSSAWGAQLALQDLARAYSADKHRYPDAYPVVELSTKTRQSKSYGKLKGPWFTVTGWATVEDVRAGRKTKAKAKVLTKEETAAELNDEIPQWGAATK
jgi:hypothetical protein